MPSVVLLANSYPLLSAALSAALPVPHAAAPLPEITPLMWTLAAAQDSAPPVAGPDDAPASEDPPESSDGREIVVEGSYGPPAGDPIEKFNAESYRITQAIDQALVEPVAYAYRDGLPEPIRDGLGNVVKNLGEPSNALNFLLQGKVGKTFETLARLAINSTLGLGGLIDIAGKPGIGLPYRRNGFANTMGYYGVGTGAYLYLPVTGATTVRDLLGNTLDQALLPFFVGRPFNRPAYAATYFVVNGLDQRLEYDAELAEIAASDDPYAMRRDTYLERRRRDIALLKGQTIPEDAAPAPEQEQDTDAVPSGPPLSLIEQVQLTARRIPAAR